MDIKEVEYNYAQCLGDGEAVCPYCGYENFIESEDYGGQDDEKIELCGNCEKYFVHQINYTITFSSEPYENYYIRTRKSLEEQRARYELNIKGDHNDSYYRMLLNNVQHEIYKLDEETRKILELN